MRITGHLDSRVARAKTARALAASDPALKVAVAQLTARVLQIVSANAARDTNRYARANEMAHNNIAGVAGVPALPVSQVKSSRFAERNLARVRQQAEHWGRVRAKWVNIVRGYEQRNGHEKWKSYKEALRILDKVGNAEDRALQQLQILEAAGEGAIILAGRGGKVKIGDSVYAGNAAVRNELLARTGRRQVLGGTRRLVRLSGLVRVSGSALGGGAVLHKGQTKSGAGWLVTVSNREPHARIVERRVRATRNAIALARAAGLKRVAGKYAEQVRAASGLAKTG